MTMDDQRLGCPVCRARFRGQVTCSRCGADLRAVMTLVARAYQLRQATRKAIRAGDAARALFLANQAQALCDTGAGRRLLRLARGLAQGFQALLDKA